LIFEAIGMAEKIQVTPEEMMGRMQSIAQSLNQKIEAVQNYYREHNLFPSLASQILEEKVLDFLIAEAKVKEEKK
jgi:FKBP-type peptidyl-prolyl cis-trans isomerase (trigger factor)